MATVTARMRVAAPGECGLRNSEYLPQNAMKAMSFLRLLLLVIAVGAAIAAIAVMLAGSAAVNLGSLWHAAAPESLNLTQAITQRYLHPAVWTHGILPVLLMPAAGVFIATAVIAMLLFLATMSWKRRQKK